MKRLRNWFIGDYLGKTSDVFERAKIELLYNYTLAFIILGSAFYAYLIYAEIWYHVYAVTFAVITLAVIPFVLKYTQNIRLASNLYIIQQVAVSNITMLLQGGKQDMNGGLWLMLFVLFAFFLYGRKWGIIVTVLFIASSSIAHALIPYVHIPERMQLPSDPAIALLPFLLGIYVVWMFMKTRSDAEAYINQQRILLQQKNQEVTDSINYARNIQQAILPSQHLIGEYLPDSFVLFLPKDIVSGDFYWVEKKDSKIFFAVVDCTGHGVPGAMMSVIGESALNRVLNEFGITQPARMLDKLNELVEVAFMKSGAHIRDGMDIALCVLDEETLELEFAGANNGLYHIRRGVLSETRADKQPIGRFEKRQPFTNHSLQLEKGDAVYLFSDGFADQFGGPQGKKFKYKRLKELLQNTWADSALSQKNKLQSSFSDWQGGLEQIDDVCIFGVKI